VCGWGIPCSAASGCYGTEICFDTPYRRSGYLTVSNSEIFEKDGVIYSEYSKTPVDIRMSNEIFVKTKEYKQELLYLAKKINFYPESMKIKLLQWIENLKDDWCISRNRKFGVQIPNSDKMFDTWFISSLTPQYLGNLKASIRFHSHDIIRSWTFYSLVMSYHLYNNIPFDNVVISGWIVDDNGKKISKSDEEKKKSEKKKPIDVVKIIKELGPNRLRYWAAKIGIGIDTIFPIEEYYQKRGLLKEFDLFERKFENFQKCIEIHEKDASDNETDCDNLILNFNNYYEKFSFNFHNYMKNFDIAKAFQEFIDIIEKYREIILGNHPNDGIKMKENKTRKNIQFSKEILTELKKIYKIFFD
jgi:valyl-tRNA synthetase